MVEVKKIKMGTIKASLRIIDVQTGKVEYDSENEKRTRTREVTHIKSGKD